MMFLFSSFVVVEVVRDCALLNYIKSGRGGITFKGVDQQKRQT